MNNRQIVIKKDVFIAKTEQPETGFIDEFVFDSKDSAEIFKAKFESKDFIVTIFPRPLWSYEGK